MPPRRSKLPVPLPEGWKVTDTSKKTWRMGKMIGKGGFGLIYLASPECDVPVRDDAVHVIKVEYHQNGPLFCELKFYQRAAKPEDIRKWTANKKLDYLGIPKYWGSGETTFNSQSYRFMVMDRLGVDLQTLLNKNNGKLSAQRVMQLGICMLDILEFIHGNEYVHCDIKAANILFSYTDQTEVYLADYGLSYRYCPNGNHKEYKENPKKGHNGTIEFTSLDAHKGVAPSRRGDLEILAYCMLSWLCGSLPWDHALRNPTAVQDLKAKLLSHLPDSVAEWTDGDDGSCKIKLDTVQINVLYRVTFLLCLVFNISSFHVQAKLGVLEKKKKKKEWGEKRKEKKEDKLKVVQANVEETDSQWANTEDLEETQSQWTPLRRNPKIRSKNNRQVYVGEDRYINSVYYYAEEHFNSPQRKSKCCSGEGDYCHTYFAQDMEMSRSLQSYMYSAEDEEETFPNNYENSLFQDVSTSDHHCEMSPQYCRDLYKYGVAIPLFLLMIYIALYGL
eukprot:XP_012818713.1 PREDICTED: serine/threonine-protein kinase VRK2 [Xenopus tropicalis]